MAPTHLILQGWIPALISPTKKTPFENFAHEPVSGGWELCGQFLVQ